MSNARQLAANLPREGGLSNRNLIINGAMQVWQRGTSQTTGGYGSVDRWQIVNITSASRQTDAPSGFQYSIQIEHSSPTFPFIAQKWEAANVQHLSGADITLSFWAKSVSGTASLFAEILTPNVVDTYSAVTARENTSWATPSTSWTKYTYTFANVNAAVSNGLEIRIGLQNQSAGSIRITGVQLEVGDTATPFEHRSYGDELARCQRYFYSSSMGEYSWAPNQSLHGAAATVKSVAHPVTMRAGPTTSYTFTDYDQANNEGFSATDRYARGFFQTRWSGQYCFPYWSYSCDAEL